ncbi:MAG: hypothetical protein MZV70_28920 [Desulfobacterales bacterium]|nr:hypothetical protein [Desulfobacterales bacterium]
MTDQEYTSVRHQERRAGDRRPGRLGHERQVHGLPLQSHRRRHRPRATPGPSTATPPRRRCCTSSTVRRQAGVPADPPVITLSNTELGRSGFEGSTAESQRFDLMNSGAATMNYTADGDLQQGLRAGWSLNPLPASGTPRPRRGAELHRLPSTPPGSPPGPTTPSSASRTPTPLQQPAGSAGEPGDHAAGQDPVRGHPALHPEHRQPRGDDPAGPLGLA